MQELSCDYCALVSKRYPIDLISNAQERCGGECAQAGPVEPITIGGISSVEPSNHEETGQHDRAADDRDRSRQIFYGQAVGDFIKEERHVEGRQRTTNQTGQQKKQ